MGKGGGYRTNPFPSQLAILRLPRLLQPPEETYYDIITSPGSWLPIHASLFRSSGIPYTILPIPAASQVIEEQKLLLVRKLHENGISTHSSFIKDEDIEYEV
jgi:hypothetical protein